jgi:hypothetical protein
VSQQSDVKVRVNVNEAGDNELAHRVNSVFRFCVEELPDRCNLLPDYAYIGEERLSPSPVNDAPVHDKPIKHAQITRFQIFCLTKVWRKG